MLFVTNLVRPFENYQIDDDSLQNHFLKLQVKIVGQSKCVVFLLC